MENKLLGRIDRLHTTELGEVRIRKNLSLEVDDVMEWCRSQVISPQATFLRKGKNWYVTVDGVVLTINATSFSVITAHRIG